MAEESPFVQAVLRIADEIPLSIPRGANREYAHRECIDPRTHCSDGCAAYAAAKFGVEEANDICIEGDRLAKL